MPLPLGGGGGGPEGNGGICLSLEAITALLNPGGALLLEIVDVTPDC